MPARYVVAEVIELPDGGSLSRRASWLLRYASGPILIRTDHAERRTYNNLLANPAEHPLA